MTNPTPDTHNVPTPNTEADHHGQVPNRTYYINQEAHDRACMAVRRSGLVELPEDFVQAQLAEARLALEAAFGEAWDPENNPGDALLLARFKQREHELPGLEADKADAEAALQNAKDQLAEARRPRKPWVGLVAGISTLALSAALAPGMVQLGTSLNPVYGGWMGGAGAVLMGLALAMGNLWLGQHQVGEHESRLRNAGQAAVAGAAPVLGLLLFAGPWRWAIALGVVIAIVVGLLTLYARALPERFEQFRQDRTAHERAARRVQDRQQKLGQAEAELAACKAAMKAHEELVYERDAEAHAKVKAAALMEEAVRSGLLKGIQFNKADRFDGWLRPVSTRPVSNAH